MARVYRSIIRQDKDLLVMDSMISFKSAGDLVFPGPPGKIVSPAIRRFPNRKAQTAKGVTGRVKDFQACLSERYFFTVFKENFWSKWQTFRVQAMAPMGILSLDFISLSAPR